jgi:hypothetical protein
VSREPRSGFCKLGDYHSNKSEENWRRRRRVVIQMAVEDEMAKSPICFLDNMIGNHEPGLCECFKSCDDSFKINS